MKKNLLFAVLLLCAAPTFAQDGPTRTAQDAKEMFFQDFESDWDEWTSKEIDRITSVSYYNVPWDVTKDDNNLKNVNLWSDSRDWTRYGERDTLIILKNGAVTTDDPDQVEAFSADSYTIVNDKNDPSRQEQLDQFGTDGGDYYFRWTSDTVGSSISKSDWGDVHTDGTVARYRRNLFIRGLNIEEQSSYRLTMYVKAKKLGQTTPTLYADVMRGYFASEKPFTMGVLDNADNYQYKRAFEYTKNDFKDDEWEKVTFMTYYLNDTTAQDFVFIDGYWWAEEWKWRNPNGSDDTLCYIMQPDKYFVRLSFASDSTIFSVDNISLTKSWIGGVEYNGDLLRVDFGYQTNLNTLVKEAYERTKIGAVELPGTFFEVWGYTDDGGWEEVEIASAEYHDDGYMYMWTKPLEIEGMDPLPNLFDDFDSVLVSFTNPVDDPTLCLKYTGDMFPKALDVDWIKDGKKVPDFHNEIGMANPYAGVGVSSLKYLPPVVQRGITAEFGSFQLDGGMKEMTFKVSRKVEFDNEPGTELATMKVVGAGSEEWWTVKEATDTSVTFQRPTGLAPLAGDYEFTLMQLKGAYTEYAEPFSVSYSFGKATYDPNTPSITVDFSSWETESGYKQNLSSNGFSVSKCATKVTEFGGKYPKALMFGLYGQNTGAENNATNCCKLFYTFDWSAAAEFDLEIGATGCLKNSWNDGCLTRYFLYDEAGNEIDLTPDDDATTYFEKGGFNIKPKEGAAVDEVEVINIHLDELAAGTYKLAITLPNEGSWGGGHRGGLILYYMKAGEQGTMATPYLASFAAAQKMLAAQINKALEDPDNYTGEKYQAALNIQTQYAPFNVDKLETAPSAWNAATKAVSDATGALEARMALVDGMWAAYNKSIDLAASYDEKSEADGVDYSDFESYQTLLDNCAEYEDFIAKDATDDEIKEIQAIFEADQKALDAEKESYDAYMKVFNEAKELLNAENAVKSYEEYAALEEVFNEYDENFYAVSASNDERSEAVAEIQAAIDAYNAHMSGYIAFTTALENAKAQLEAEDANPDLAAYAALEELYAQYENWDAVAATEEELAAATTALAEATAAYANILSTARVNRIYYQALADLAEQVEANLGDNAEEYAERAANADDDAALENLYKTAIKAAIYNKVANGEELEIPVSAFIKNNELWANVKIVDRTDKKMPANAGDLSKVDEGGANIQNVMHEYNNVPIWIMILNNDYTDLLPGWNVKAEQNGAYGGGNGMATVTNDSYQEFKDGKTFWNGEIGMDWTTKVTLTQTLEDLPVGIYSIGANIIANSQSAKFDVTAAESISKSFDNVTDNQGVDGVKVDESTETVKLTFILSSNEGWSRADDFYMTFTGAVEGFDYAAAAAEAQKEVEEIITFVPEVAGAAKVEYYGLDGIALQTPKAGQIAIKVTKAANGQRTIEKIRVK